MLLFHRMARAGAVFAWAALLLLMSCTSRVDAITNATHAEALRQLFVDTGGAAGTWTGPEGWRATGGDPCADQWTGITCDTQGQVTQLVMMGNQLAGSIDAVAAITSLTRLSLRSNQLSGSIDAVAGLTGLERLALDGNQFSGGVGAVAGLSRLTALYLHGNELLDGPLDVSRLASLAELDITGTGISHIVGHTPFPDTLILLYVVSNAPCSLYPLTAVSVV